MKDFENSWKADILREMAHFINMAGGANLEKKYAN